MKTFEELQTELYEVLAWFESDSADIDQAEAKYKEGLQLAAELKLRLQQTENKIEKLKVSFDESASS